MTEHQGRLWDFGHPDCPPAQHHSPTSVAAAESIKPLVGISQAAVLAAIVHAGTNGMTDEEIIDFTSLSPSTARPRRIELVEKRLVRDSGRTRKTRSGRSATVWVAKEFS